MTCIVKNFTITITKYDILNDNKRVVFRKQTSFQDTDSHYRD